MTAMAATCAVCERPIARGEKFVLAETEVMHRRCAGGRTLLTRTRTQAAEERIQAELVHRDEIETWRRRFQNVVIHAQSAARLEGDIRRLQADKERLIVERDVAIAERDRSMAFARVAQIQPAPDAAPATTAAPPVESSTVDDAAVRFSLLELDIV